MARSPDTEAEQAMIARVFAPLAAGLPGALGLKDDAAVLALPQDRQVILTMDTLVENVHFLFDGTKQQAADAAYKALAVNISDLVAKGADPLAYMLSLTLPATGAQDWLDGVRSGLRQGQSEWNIQLAGGDTVRGTSGLALTITALGTVPAGTTVLRSGARPGDRLVVSGSIGDAWAGLQLCLGDGHLNGKLEASDTAYLVDRYRRPVPRLGMVTPLRQLASAAMDISDGLILDLERLCAASGVGATVNAGSVPLSPALRRLISDGAATLTDALTGGDDYEILAAVPPARLHSCMGAAAECGVRLTDIGEVTETAGVHVIDVYGQAMSLPHKGWDHLSEPRE